tara:strand:- start:1253 stop:1471 length:219 start_codon:yes stop_codon:yes gene_type:complete
MTITEAIESLKKEYPSDKCEFRYGKDDTGNGIEVFAEKREYAHELRKYFPMRYEGYRVFVMYKGDVEKWGEH